MNAALPLLAACTTYPVVPQKNHPSIPGRFIARVLDTLLEPSEEAVVVLERYAPDVLNPCRPACNVLTQG